MPTPTLDSERAYVQVGNRVHALDRVTGREAWRADLSPVVGTEPRGLLVDAERVYVVADRAIALDKRSGAQLWNVSLPSSSGLAVGAVHGTLVLVGSRTHHVRALRVTDGVQEWEADLSQGSTLPGVVTGITATRDTAFVALTTYLNTSGGWRQGVVVALDRLSGAEHWRYTTPDSASSAHGAPALATTRVLVNNLSGGAVLGLDRSDGRFAWEMLAPADRFGPIASAIIEGDRAYVGSNDGSAYALRWLTGEIIWQRPIGTAISSIVKCGRLLLLNHLRLSAVDAATGTRISSPTLASVQLAQSGFAVAENTAIVVADDRLIAIACPE